MVEIDLHTRIGTFGSVRSVRLRGTIEASDAGRLASTLGDAAAADDVVVDLTQVGRADAEGLDGLREALRVSRRNRPTVLFVVPDLDLRASLVLAGIDDLATVVHDRTQVEGLLTFPAA